MSDLWQTLPVRIDHEWPTIASNATAHGVVHRRARFPRTQPLRRFHFDAILNTSEKATMATYLATAQNAIYTLSIPATGGNVTGRWSMDWSMSYLGPNTYRVTATLIESPRSVVN